MENTANRKLVEEMVSRNMNSAFLIQRGWPFMVLHDHQIGVDIEYVREVPEMDQIAGQFFSEGEKQVLRQPSRKRENGCVLRILDHEGKCPQG